MLVVLPLLFLLLVSPPASTGAAPEDEYKQIQEKMREEKKKLGEAQERESSILNELETVNMNLEKIETELKSYRKEMGLTEAEIREVHAGIAKTEKSLEKQKEWIKRKLKMMQRSGYSGDLLVTILSSEDISQVMRIWKYMESITRHEHTILDSYRENLAKLEEKISRLNSLKQTLGEKTEKVQTKEAEMAEKRKTKEMILSSVRQEKASRQKMLAELKEASKRLQDLIRESSRTDSYAASGFAKLKGKLIWPADGRVAIRYGSQRDSQFNTPVFRNGIHIQTEPDAEVLTVYEGKVIFAEWFKGFGQLVIVNHGSGYHTLYGNLSEIFSRVGDIIKNNQIVGKVGTSGILNAPGLYFEIRYKGKPLDPQQWLKYRRR